ncbi:neural-cadherin-like [Eriocheir sinensis]|uniref:neural-cadherin-like n=1 Tax=Eriocheir sinensis TaxID=95602 RepID=UPI0021C85A5D|nr:neural-cadherin-like [Eriocheir sinensis]
MREHIHSRVRAHTLSRVRTHALPEAGGSGGAARAPHSKQPLLHRLHYLHPIHVLKLILVFTLLPPKVKITVRVVTVRVVIIDVVIVRVFAIRGGGPRDEACQCSEQQPLTLLLYQLSFYFLFLFSTSSPPGTCTVVVRVADENDNPPRFTRRRWKVTVPETHHPGEAAPNPPNPPNTTLLELTAGDRDEDTHLLYRVEPQSGPGWDIFKVRSVGSSGQLLALQGLDYEQEAHRRGFRFRVQVTDKGPHGWEDLGHVDSAWVTILLSDVNDNPPVFLRPHADVTVSEDAAPGTLLASLPAHDADEGKQHGIDYRLEGGWGALTVDTEADVSLAGPLDREAPGGAVGKVRVVAVDRGDPPLSATATLTVTVEDVNDCPPTLLPPTVLHVTEGGPPALLSVLKATDPDVWALGHGPPFTFSLAPSNPAHVLSLISLKFNPRLDSGRGGAELWTVGAVDREQHRQLSVAVRVSDAQGLAATHRLTVLVDDLNDNPMKPAAKSVYLWKTQGGGGAEVPLGRVFVEDPDDWDLEDKEFEWAGTPHPLFSLHPSDGTIVASGELREGRYDLQFSVSDRAWRQHGVAANVTVTVQTLPAEALTHAVPLALSPVTPEDLTRGWSPSEGGGMLGTLLKAVGEALSEPGNTVGVVSVYAGDSGHPSSPPLPLASTVPASPLTALPSTCVWVSAKDGRGRFMNPLKLQGLLALHTRQLESATGVSVVVAEDTTPAPSVASQGGSKDPASGGDENTRGGLYTAPSLASTGLPLQVVDANATSLITPRLTRAHACHHDHLRHHYESSTCTPTSCLNGGSCVRTVEGTYRCVCPEQTEGAQCKLLGRTFWGSGWAWLRPLPPCLPITLSLRLLTRHPHGLLLYAGPLSPPAHPTASPPMLALQLVDGRPQALIEGGGSPVKLEVNVSLHDGRWHTLHLSLDHQAVVMMVDLCGRGWKDEHTGDAHCLARTQWNLPSGGGAWLGSGPLQVGGLAHAPPEPLDYGWREAPTRHNLSGCLSRLTVNTQVLDLGALVHSHANVRGCRPQHAACPGGCGVRGHCVGGLKHPHCECDPGWAGPSCAAPTTPARLDSTSYFKVALSFSPGPWVVRVQVRVRLHGARTGLLVQLATHHSTATFTLHLQAGVACGAVSGAEVASRRVCVERHPLGDGAWHTIRAERHGHNLRLSVDDGDGWRCNETLPSLAAPSGLGPPTPLRVDKQGGVAVGGVPSFVGVDMVMVHHDLHDACLDDLRVSGRRLPMPPALNTTSWGQMTTAWQLAQGCRPREDPCTSSRCAPPLTCTPAWDQPSCSCGPGRQLVDDVCEDVNECQWQPCLHGGTCQNLRPGFLCACEPGHLGDHCQWVMTPREAHPLAVHAGVAVLALSLLLLVVLAVLLSLLLRRLRQSRAVPERREGRGLMGRVTGKGESRADLSGICDTQLELMKMKTLGVVPNYTENNPMASRRESSGEVSLMMPKAPPTPLAPCLLDPAIFLPAESPSGCSRDVDSPQSSPQSYGGLQGADDSPSAGQRHDPTSGSPHYRGWQWPSPGPPDPAPTPLADGGPT